jgi:hypothetical protein
MKNVNAPKPLKPILKVEKAGDSLSKQPSIKKEVPKHPKQNIIEKALSKIKKESTDKKSQKKV